MKLNLAVILGLLGTLLLVVGKFCTDGIASQTGTKKLIESMHGGSGVFFVKKHISHCDCWQFFLHEGDNIHSRPVQFDRALELLGGSDSSFRNMLVQQLSDIGLESYFWEHPPVSTATLSSVHFEFTLIPARRLLRRPSDPLTFSYKFNDCSGNVVSFPNIGNDAVLVVPCPVSSLPQSKYSEYGHIAAFVRGAPEGQVHVFLRSIAAALRQRLNSNAEKIWLSTSGLGVQWLHARLDSTPKYYNWEPYKM